LENGDWLLFWF